MWSRRTPGPESRSQQHRFVGSPDPLSEAFAVVPVGQVGLRDPFDVVGQFFGGHLVTAQFAAEAGIQAE